jgi:hypothetical protein
VTVEVLGPKGPVNRFGGTDMLRWARHQLGVAYDIVDNPGGGLGFAIQTIGQVKTGLREQGGDAYEQVAETLDAAEEEAVYRHFDGARALVQEALRQLPQA